MFDSIGEIRLIATDMDGTLTTAGKFTSKLLQTFDDLNNAGIKVLIVTGRSAGWVSGLAHYLPIVGAIAENGGMYYPSAGETGIFISPIPDLIKHRQQLATTFAELKAKFPQIQESNDNIFRITDWTFDVAELSTSELQIIAHLCENMGWGFTYSTIQCHIKPQRQDKAIALLKVLQEYFPEYSSNEVVTVGDSPNDESLFDPRYFPLSVGVANVREYVDRLQQKPAYITNAAEGEGFCELAKMIKTGNLD
ncbi:HAD family hydrolase [Brunnivagina elsteri]|uniref:HAD family hydrolase n=1 Tax=Brunnivagina elsteri CCALA 953 TaxID=987040 RepID=A0A2A2THC1_9CYAN|nr:HAD family hydrolase [Calothrix elsteri]PAX53028.1 HAD family hydrolase [Calothrix elsteri CCALA 953]